MSHSPKSIESQIAAVAPALRPEARRALGALDRERLDAELDSEIERLAEAGVTARAIDPVLDEIDLALGVETRTEAPIGTDDIAAEVDRMAGGWNRL